MKLSWNRWVLSIIFLMNVFYWTTYFIYLFFRSGRDSYGDHGIGYVQVKRQGDICIVKCRITPEHRARTKPYHCSLECNEKEDEVLSVICDDCAASKGGCKHTIALLMWLHRSTEEPSPTDVKCYWKKSKLAGENDKSKFCSVFYGYINVKYILCRYFEILLFK